jgi:hypothetical protein
LIRFRDSERPEEKNKQDTGQIEELDEGLGKEGVQNDGQEVNVLEFPILT